MGRWWAAMAISLASGAWAQELPARELASTTPQVTAGEVILEPPAPDVGRAPVRFGAQLGLISIPRPLSAELFFRFYDLVGVGVAYSALPSGLSDIALALANVQDASVESSAIEAEVRLFPFHGSFFIGTSFGRQSLTATATTQNVTVSADMTTLFITPKIGWLAVFHSGLTLGVDLGVQVPLTTDISITSNDSQAASDARSVAQAIGDTPLPSLNFRVGFLL